MYTAHTLSQIAIDNGYSNESSFIKILESDTILHKEI